MIVKQSISPLENTTLDSITDSDISVIKTILDKKPIDNSINASWQKIISKESSDYMGQVKKEEKNRYIINCGLIILASGSLLLCLLYKIGALNIILGR